MNLYFYLMLKIKSVVTLMAFEVMWILAFILISIFPMLTDAFGAHSVYFMFAVSCIIGTLFCSRVLPETKGKTYDQIIKELEK